MYPRTVSVAYSHGYNVNVRSYVPRECFYDDPFIQNLPLTRYKPGITRIIYRSVRYRHTRTERILYSTVIVVFVTVSVRVVRYYYYYYNVEYARARVCRLTTLCTRENEKKTSATKSASSPVKQYRFSLEFSVQFKWNQAIRNHEILLFVYVTFVHCMTRDVRSGFSYDIL